MSEDHRNYFVVESSRGAIPNACIERDNAALRNAAIAEARATYLPDGRTEASFDTNNEGTKLIVRKSTGGVIITEIIENIPVGYTYDTAAGAVYHLETDKSGRESIKEIDTTLLASQPFFADAYRLAMLVRQLLRGGES